MVRGGTLGIGQVPAASPAGTPENNDLGAFRSRGSASTSEPESDETRSRTADRCGLQPSPDAGGPDGSMGRAANPQGLIRERRLVPAGARLEVRQEAGPG